MGVIFNIQRYCVNDGPGIRTTVFFKGCPLRCVWCHNPESKRIRPQLFYNEEKCLGCGECVKICPNGCHGIVDGRHLFNRTNCAACGKCASACPSALDLAGKQVSARDVLRVVENDRIFYAETGGMTLSGGEPFYQFDFMMELLKGARDMGIHTCVETCGYTSGDRIKAAAPYIGIFLFDVKETDASRHERYTGARNEPILENLRLLDKLGAYIVLRCPIIPGCNDRYEHFAAIGDITRKYKSVRRVEVEPYHPLGAAKSKNLGVEYTLDGLNFADEGDVRVWMEAIRTASACEVIRA